MLLCLKYFATSMFYFNVDFTCMKSILKSICSCRWICVYPAYVNSKKTIQQGRKIPKSKVCLMLKRRPFINLKHADAYEFLFRRWNSCSQKALHVCDRAVKNLRLLGNMKRLGILWGETKIPHGQTVTPVVWRRGGRRGLSYVYLSGTDDIRESLNWNCYRVKQNRNINFGSLNNYKWSFLLLLLFRL